MTAELYLWCKALHIASVIAWMAGMFYLPRLYVYHAERAEAGSELEATFLIMQGKLRKVIMAPALIASWVFGLALLFFGAVDWSMIWPWAKALSVLAMTGMHVWLVARGRDFERGTNTWTGRQFRIANEIPTVLMLIIVVSVVVRPV